MTTVSHATSIARHQLQRRHAGRVISPWLALPALLPIAVFSIYPILRGIALGFTDARSGSTASAAFTGVENYVNLVANPYFWNSFRVGAAWGLGVTALQFLASLGLALLLNADIRMRWLARVLAIAPWAMPPVVIGYTWRLVFASNGMVNSTLIAGGIDAGNTAWLADPKWALAAVIVVGVWAGMPQTTIVLLAGLQTVPAELKEAATLDGAGLWRLFTSVTWPHIKQIAVAIVTLDFIWNFNSFGLVYVLTAGGPGNSTQLPMLFAFQEAFRYGNYGVGAAIGNVLMVITSLVVMVFLGLTFRKASR